MSDVIESAALRVAVAESKLKDAHTAIAAAQKAAGEINARVAALESERFDIVAQARVGDADGKLGLRLAVLDADLADIRKIAADAKVGLANAQAEVERAKLALATAEQQMALVKDEVMERELVAHVDRLAQLLGAGIAELRAVWKRRNARPTFVPPEPLVTERLDNIAKGRLSHSFVAIRNGRAA